MRLIGIGTLAMLLALAVVPARVAAETLEQRLERMEQEIRDLRAELRRRDAAGRQRGGTAGRASATRHAAEPEAAPPPAVAAAPAPAPATPVAAASAAPEGGPLRGLMDRVAIGGYGSMRYEGSSLKDQNQTFTYRRFVLTTDANIAPQLRAYFELEFERFRKLELEKTTSRNAEGGVTVEQAVDGTDASEISVEQAWLQWDMTKWVKLRAGEVLVPLGRFNLNHDDDRWDLPRRSLVDRGVPVLPSAAAWGELGVGLLGDLPVGEEGQFSYQGYVVNGLSLDTEFEHVLSTRKGDTTKNEIEAKISPSTGTFGSDVKDAKAITGRLAWSPRLGHEIAASGYYGQYTPDYLGKEDLWALAADGRTGWGPFELEGEYVYTHYEGIPNVARNLARTALQQESEAETGSVETEVEFELANLARAKQGYWLEGRYRFWPDFLSDTFLGRPFANPQLIAVLRGEQVWLDGLVQDATFSGGRLTTFEEDHRYVARFTSGLAYRPVPLVAFQLAYEFTMTDSGQSLSGVTNFLPAGPHEDHAHTVLVGATFGF
jgi:hypothetical protein